MSIKIEKSPIDSERYFSRALMEAERSVLLKKIKERNNKSIEIKDKIKKIEDFIKSKNFEIKNITNEIDLINQDVLILKNKFERSSKKEKELKDDLYSKLLNLLGKKSELSEFVYYNFDKFINERDSKEKVIKNKTNTIRQIELQIIDLKNKIEELNNELFLLEKESLYFKKDFLDFIEKRKIFFDNYKPIIDGLFKKFKNNDFNGRDLDLIQKEIEDLKLKNEINEEIEDYLNNYIDNLKQRNIKFISNKKNVVFIHSITSSTTGSNSSLSSNSIDSYKSDLWIDKINILLSLNPNISTSTISEMDNEKSIFGGRFGVVVSDGFIDTAIGGDSFTKSNSLYATKNYSLREDYSFKHFSQSDREHIKTVLEIEKNQVKRINDIYSSIENKYGLAGKTYNEITIQNPSFSGIFICTNDGDKRLSMYELEKNGKIPELFKLYNYQNKTTLYEMYNGLFYKIKIEKKDNKYVLSIDEKPSNPYETDFSFSIEEKDNIKRDILSSEKINPRRLGSESIIEEKNKFDQYIRGLREYKFDSIVGLYQDYIDYIFGYKLDFDIDANNELLSLVGLSFKSDKIKKYIKEEKDKNEKLNSLELKNIIINSDKFKKFIYNKVIEFLNRLIKNINNPVVLKTIYLDPFYIKGLIEKHNILLEDLSEESKIFLENIFQEKGVVDLIERRCGKKDVFIVKPDEVELI